MFTLGNVDRRRRRDAATATAAASASITDHEDVHVWQARWFGPLYPVLYGAWWSSAAVAALAVWVVRRRREPFAKVVESCAYYLNPFEWWAYSRDDHWPPPQAVKRFVWPRPLGRKLRR